MKRSRFQRLVSLFCLTLYLAASLSPAKGFVLCFEPDGRVVLEPSSIAGLCAGCPESDSTDDGRERPASLASQDVPCPCIDVSPFASEEISKPRASRSDSEPARLFASALPVPIGLPRIANPQAPFLRTSHTSPSSRALPLIRTVVLLI